MQFSHLINLIRSVDVAANDTFAPFNRNGVIDVEALMQLVAADSLEEFDFMAESFNDSAELLVSIYTGVKTLGEYDYAGLPHALVDSFTKYGFILEDRLVNEEELRVIQTPHVTLIVERFGDDEPLIDTGEQDEDDEL